jgi:uncharacterized membrane protein YhfC
MDFNWLLFAVQMLVMVVLPLPVGILLARRWHLPQRMLFIASVFFLLNLIAQQPLFFLFRLFSGNNSDISPLVKTIYSAVVYGVVEEVFRYLSFRTGRAMRKHRTWQGALVAGVGHGGCESILFGLFAAATTIVALTNPGVIVNGHILTLPTAEMMLSQAVLRLQAITAHMGFAVMIVQAYARHRVFYFLLAIVWHFLVDAVTFSTQLISGNNLLLTLLVFLVWDLVAIAYIWLQRPGRHWQSEAH